jgi:hypothetical protein
LKLRIIEQRLFQWLSVLIIVSLLAISFWMIYQAQTKQGGQQQQETPPVPKQSDQSTEPANQPAISERYGGAVQEERKTLKSKVHVTANDTGVVTIRGGEGIIKLVQYCPGEQARGCDENITIKREGNSFMLDKVGLAHNQTVFNFMYSSEKWLRVLQEEVTCGANVRCETGNSYFTYTGAAAKK